jgi:putative phosphoserine phosphatase/1-acylglycerol-3-phosphate O-acyltransferase
MARGAAFFDLDRTLLGGASGPVYTAALRDQGAVPARSIPGEGLVFGFFNVFGETRPSIMLTKQAIKLAAGRERAAFQRAGEAAAPLLVAQIQSYAAGIFDEHRAAGRPIVMATTTPFDLVAPLAEALGMDDVVATRYAEEAGYYTGKVDGHFVWGRGKLRAVTDWASARDIDLGASYAYSDSYFDLPLLNGVGNPTAVNPDARLAAAAAVRRWPIRFLDAPPGVMKLVGFEAQEALFPLVRPEFFPYVRFDIEGTELLPETGGAILVGNHRSYFDPVAMAVTVARGGRPVRFLGKKEVFDAPVVGQIAASMGGIRVDRASGSDAPLREAARALEAGDLVTMMPQGTIPRGPAFFDPKLKGRWGAARLAALTGAPIQPIGLWGTEKVWPRSARLPNVTSVAKPPKIRVRVGEPISFDFSSTDPSNKELDAATKKMMKSLTKLLPKKARQAYEPTEEELRSTFPPGYDGDPSAEAERRPGTD